jgi:hypothetical protein
VGSPTVTAVEPALRKGRDSRLMSQKEIADVAGIRW